jgi:FHA domain
MEASLNGPSGNIPLTSSVLTIGRAADNQLALADPQSSSHHAEVRPDAQGHMIVDVNSMNGTFVNEQRLAPHAPRLLISGDVIRIGTTRFTYETAGSFDATLRAGVADFAGQEYLSTMATPPPAAPSPAYHPASQPGYQEYQPPPAYPAPQPGYQPPQYSQPQQGYPQAQAGFQQQWGAVPLPPAAQPRKKRRTGLLIGIVVLFLVLVGGGIGGYLILRSTPEKTLQAYCTALLNSDAHGVFNQLSSRAQSRTSVAKISTGFQAVDKPLVGGFKTCTFSNVQENGSSATATIKFTVGNTIVPPITSNDVLVDENGTWKIDIPPTQSPTPIQ